jgi:molybdopterin synthase catalytic subunit
MSVSVQLEDFDVAQEMNSLRLGQTDVGALALFVGCVRDLNEGLDVSAMTLEHYPEMTQRCLEKIVQEARGRFDIKGVRVIHRFGTLYPTDQIVMVAVASKHRGLAFDACEFIMDYLKTQAPFWKKETTPAGQRWVESRHSDDQAAAKWNQSSEG